MIITWTTASAYYDILIKTIITRLVTSVCFLCLTEVISFLPRDAFLCWRLPFPKPYSSYISTMVFLSGCRCSYSTDDMWVWYLNDLPKSTVKSFHIWGYTCSSENQRNWTNKILSIFSWRCQIDLSIKPSSPAKLQAPKVLINMHRLCGYMQWYYSWTNV